MTKHVTMIAKHIKAEEKNVWQRIQATVYRHSPLLPYYYCHGQRGKEKNTKKSGCPWASHAACGATTGWGLRDGNGGQNQAISGLPHQVFDLPSVRLV